MFEHLAKHPKILVTGPQRSGTRIVSHMIAADTGHRHVDEREIDFRDVRKLEKLLRSTEPMVVQAPCLSHLAGTLPWYVVFMIRSIEEIQRSENRIGWQGEAGERVHYGNYSRDLPISAVKYQHWFGTQKRQRNMRNLPYLEQEYDQLEKHGLWVPASQRQFFRTDQVRRDYHPYPDTWTAQKMREMRERGELDGKEVEKLDKGRDKAPRCATGYGEAQGAC